MIQPKDVLDRHADLKALRAPEESQWRDIAELIRPEQSDMFSGNARTDVFDDVFDSTGIQALESFGGGIFGQMTNPSNRWFSLTLADEELAKWYPVKTWLYAVENILYASLSPAVSSFYTHAPAWFSDLGAFGIATLYQEEQVGRGRILDRVVPLGESYIDTDAEGEVDTFHREFKLRGDKALRKFPELERGPRIQEKTEYTFVHACQQNPFFREGALGPEGMPFLSTYVCSERQDFIRLGGYSELPYHTVMWSRRPGRTWPVGPGHFSRPDVATLNEVERTKLVATQFAAEPVLLTEDESQFTPADVYPNAVLAGTMGANGKPTVGVLNRAQNLQFAERQANERRDAVRAAFYFSIMQLIDRPQMTATEFLGFQEEQLRLMAPNLARIQAQGLSPLLARRFGMLQRAGQIPPPPEEMDQQRIDISYVSPLAKIQTAQRGQATLRWIGGLSQIVQATGDPSIMDNVDRDATADVLLEAYGPPPAVRLDPRKVDELRQARAAQAAGQQDLDQAAQISAIQAEVAHAEQAKTLAAGRPGS